MPAVYLGNGRHFCAVCRKSLPADKFKKRGVVCCKCSVQRNKESAVTSKNKAVAKAARDLTRALAESKHARDSADMPTIINRFKEQLGGSEAIADLLLDDFRTARGDKAHPEAGFRRNETLIQKYHHMFLKAIQSKDDSLANASDLSHLDEEDLKATLVGLARDIIANDHALRMELAAEALQNSPELVVKALQSIGIEVIDNDVADNKVSA